MGKINKVEMCKILEDLKFLEFKFALALAMVEFKGQLVESRKLVQIIDEAKIEIYPEEHGPPHFHVKTKNEDVSIAIESFKILNGSLKRNTLRKVKYFYDNNRELLISFWNATRPSNCRVGPIKISN